MSRFIYDTDVARVDILSGTMIVEADVNNASGELEPGMYPEVALHLDSNEPSLIVPSASIKEEEGKCIVMRITGGVAKPVQVTCKETVGENVEVVGDLRAGDEITVGRLQDDKRLIDDVECMV